jgi:hypothetical protein
MSVERLRECVFVDLVILRRPVVMAFASKMVLEIPL